MWNILGPGVTVGVSPLHSVPFLLAETCRCGHPASAMFVMTMLGGVWGGHMMHGEVLTTYTAHLHLDTVA